MKEYTNLAMPFGFMISGEAVDIMGIEASVEMFQQIDLHLDAMILKNKRFSLRIIFNGIPYIFGPDDAMLEYTILNDN